MRLFTLIVGTLHTNCYVLMPDEGAGPCIVIDPGADGHRIGAELAKRRLKPEYILSTHGHADHTGGVAPLIEAVGGKFAIGRADLDTALHPPGWLTGMLTAYMPPPEPGFMLEGEEELVAGGVNLKVLATPGHTPGSCSFLAGDWAFTGDTLFKGSIGRYDLPGGDGAQEIASIRTKLLTLADSVVVHPGHGPQTTIGQERWTNPYLQKRPG